MFGRVYLSLCEADLKMPYTAFGLVYHRIGGLIAGTLAMLFLITLGYFRPFQPQKINTLPIVIS
jgi:hypothetical protein